MKRRLALVGVLGFGLVAHGVGAEPLGRPGQVVLSAERLTGVYAESLTSESSDSTVDATSEYEYKSSSVSIALFGQGGYLTAESLQGPATIPRLALDGFVTQGLSLGGSLMYLRGSGESEVSSSTTDLATGETTSYDEDDETPTVSVFQIAPRIGYAFALNDAWSLWPRAGVIYTQYASEDENVGEDDDGGDVTVTTETTLSFTSASLEFLVAASPIENIAFFFGPYADLPLGSSFESETSGGGDSEPDDSEPDVSYVSYGLTAGFGVVF